MTAFGFHASHEQWPPSRLLQFLQQAERTGFDAGMCSDHFYPWSERQGQSGHAWSWLGAALATTKLTLGTVCAPGQRYHPAIIAQAAATLAEIFPDRFWLAVGSGEALNENITGDPWPDKESRNERLRECVQVMRRLWAGELVNHDGHVRVKDAKLFTRPSRPPLVFGAAITEETAEWVGGWADGLITVGNEIADLRKLVEACHRGGGAGKPCRLQVALSYAATEEEAVGIAWREWRQCGLEPRLLSDLPTPWAFDQATQSVSREQVRRQLRISADLDEHIDWLLDAASLGFEAIYLHYLGRDHDRWIELCAERVLPALQKSA